MCQKWQGNLRRRSFSLGQLLASIRKLGEQYDTFQVASGSLSDPTTDVGLDPIIDAYADEGGELILRIASPDEEQEDVPTPMRFSALVSRLEALQADCSDYPVECSESDPNDTESMVRIDMPVQGIGISDEHQLFVFLH